MSFNQGHLEKAGPIKDPIEDEDDWIDHGQPLAAAQRCRCRPFASIIVPVT